ncbi:MAG: segregation/condensation protein A [Desulfobacteraceae bacterium]|nr:segregation/condensation protein A [Desulfobacteraceae bacterium]
MEDEALGPEDTYRVRLDGVFEGPMDLLVHLIKKHELDIYDIPIAMITDQYLAYLEWMQAMNIDFAGEFLLMASTLAHIKSRMLLPVHGGEDDEDEDPRSQITRPLLEYLKMKNAAEMLAERPLLGDGTFVRRTDTKAFIDEAEGEMIQVGLFELIDAFQRILQNVSPDQKVALTADGISVKDRINQLVDVLEESGSITFEELFPEGANRADIIVTFLALLEMVKIELIRVVQHVQSGIMRIFYL